jgi:hypothetical protein
MDEFGVMDDGDNLALKSAPSLAGQLQNTTRSSRPWQNALIEPLRYLLRLMCEDRKDVERGGTVLEAVNVRHPHVAFEPQSWEGERLAQFL